LKSVEIILCVIVAYHAGWRILALRNNLMLLISLKICGIWRNLCRTIAFTSFSLWYSCTQFLACENIPCRCYQICPASQPC